MNLPQITNDSRPGGLMWQVQAMVARINLVWAREHHADGRHILPRWHDVPFTAANFWSVAGFTVTAAGVRTYAYWKHGDCLCVALGLTGTLAAATDTQLTIRLPEGFVSQGYYLSVADLSPGAGAAGTTGILLAQPNESQLAVVRTDRAAFAAGAIQVFGQLLLRTTT